VRDIEYKPLLGCDYYRIGTDGSIWSRLVRGYVGLLAKTWKEVKGWSDGGYRRVRLRVDGRNRVYKVHHLVLLTFVGPAPKGCWGLHGDGNPSNNTLGNLRWGTPLENANDREKHGTHVAGSKKGNAKLTKTDVVIVFSLRDMGCSHSHIAGVMGVDRSVISRVLGGKRYVTESKPILQRK
jgi:hypothetical protein